MVKPLAYSSMAFEDLTTGALLNSGHRQTAPVIDLGIGSYKDTVSAGSSTFDTEFELIDDENVVFGLKNFKQLNSEN